MDQRPRPSDKILATYAILANPGVSVLNQLLACYGHPEDGPAELVLRDPEGSDVTVQIARVTTIEEDPATGSSHFTGDLADGGAITGHIRPGPATTEVIGKATLTL